MKKKTKSNTALYIILALVVVFVGWYLFTQSGKQGLKLFGSQNGDFGYGKGVGQGQNVQLNKNNCLADDCLLVDGVEYPVGVLPDNVKQALDKAIMDEYKALSTYEAVITKFGPTRPFSMIKNAEEQHIASLKAIYDKYGISVPENTLIGTLSAPVTLQESCQVGVEAEIANASLYRNELLPEVKDYADITMVFENLMNASQVKHLPAFERCK